MMYESSQKNHSSSKRQQKHPQLNGHTNGRVGNGKRVHVVENIYSQQHPNKMVEHICCSPQQQCGCCPYGYHIDLGFVKFAEDIAAGKEQIQNWSNEEKKRNRRLLASPSSDKTMLDLSGSDIANISSSYPANDSILSSTNFSPYMEEEELPELLEQQQTNQHYQQKHFNNNSNFYLNNQQQNGNKHNSTNQQQLQSILKKNAEQKHGNCNSQTQVLRNRNQQFSTKETLGQHRSPKQQHQSRFYETHVQQNRQQPFFLSTIENAQFIDDGETSSSPTNNFSAMAPLRTSTPKANLETQQYRLPLHIATNAFDADGCGATSSAPSSPSLSFQHLPAYQATIAHDLAQLKKTTSRGTIIQTKTQPYTSIASLSSSARGAFNNNINRQQHVISPEPRMLIQNHPANNNRQLANDALLRSSNLQSRAYFHQNIGGGVATSQNDSAATRLMPYRSRGGTTPSFSQQQNGSSSQLGSVAGSTLELAEFASVRRRRLEADIGARSPVMPSAHLVRSVSPPMHFPASKTTPIGGYAYSSTNNLTTSPSSQLLMRNYSNPLSNNYNKIIEETSNNDNIIQQQKPSISSKHSYLVENEIDGPIPKTSAKGINKNSKTNKTTYNSISADFVKQKNNIPTKTVSFMRNFGTQTMFATKQPVLKDVGITTDFTPKVIPKKIHLKEASTSPEPIIPPTSKLKELPFSSFVKFNSIGVDTTEIEELEEDIKIKNASKKPPQPPPKPSRPDLEEELRRRRQAERLASLVTEFQYCLGHEPEHLPCEEPILFEKQQKIDKSVEAINLLFPTIHKATATTSTTDLTFSINVGVGTFQPEMVEKSMETEKIRIIQVGIQTEKEEAKQLEKLINDETEKRIKIGNEKLKLLLTENESQTETDWLEKEIDVKLAEAEAERKEKRKRLSIERSTETDDDESPDQFIMITCNKCEQRSSIATDEVFEKIVDETILEVSDVVQQNNKQQQFSEQHQSSGEILETLPEETEFILTSNRNEESVKERRNKFINASFSIPTNASEFEEDVANEREKRSFSEPINIVEKEQKAIFSDVFEDIIPVIVPVVHSLHRNCNELRSIDMTNFVSISPNYEDKEENKLVELIPEVNETKTFKYFLQTSRTTLLQKSREFTSISLLNEDIVNLNNVEDKNEAEPRIKTELSENILKQSPTFLKNVLIQEENVKTQNEQQKHLETNSENIQKQAEYLQEKHSEPLLKQAEYLQHLQEKHLENTQHLQEHSEQQNQKQIQETSKHVASSSPMSSDEGLVLAEEEMFDDFGTQEIDLQLPLDIDADRFSIDTDVQTVIYVEQDGGISGYPRTRSSSSASTKTPNASIGDNTTTTASIAAAAAAAAAATARTDALRKLLTEPPRNSAATSSFFQRAADSNRSYRTDKSRAQQLQLEYIADRHKSTDAHLCSEPSTPTTSQTVFGENAQQQETTRKALKETINLKKNVSSPSTSTSPPDPIPARIPRPKIARYSPNVAHAETPDEEAEAADRLTPLRSEMRSLSSGGWGGGSSSPRMSQRSLIFRTHIGDTLEEEDDEDLDDTFQGILDSDRLKQHNRHHLPILSADNIVEDDVSPSSPSSSSNSDGGRTYEMSEEESSEFFELSAPLQDALETINDHLMLVDLKTSKMGEKSEKEKQEQQPKNNQLEWAYKYAQHEWLKMATKKNTNAEAVEQFIDALESYSTQLMDTVINMTDQNGNTALHYAVSNENFDVISVLLDSKVCRIDQMNTAGYSTLMLGALCELRNETESAIMQRLFHMGNVNAKAVKHAQTALMLAASHGRIEATNLLLKCGADVNIQDVDGSTALMCAAEHGQKEIVKILIKQPNIDASLLDCDNQTALSIAVENHYRDIGVLIYAHLNFSRSAEAATTSNTSSTLTTNTTSS